MQLKKLQFVQNTAARIITQTRKFDYITPVLSDLHWIPVSYCINAFQTKMSNEE